jgi:putative membrane protein
MSPQVQVVLENWSPPVLLTLALLLVAGLYLRGWLYLRKRSVKIIPVWRAWSFLVGLFLIWVALGSPLAAFDEELLTVHMVQHLLLMTIAPPLILLGAPMMPFLLGLPRKPVQSLAPLFRWAHLPRVGHVLTQPAVCWLAGAAALVGWHIPAAFTLGLQSEAWHVVEHGCFFASGFLFWWPVIQPWPSVATPRWSMVLYLFLATLPCDILSAFLAFCDRVVYSIYLSTPRHFGISVLQDQECAGALMWTCVTVVYLLAATVVTARLLARPSADRMELLQPELHRIATSEGDARTAEVA